MQQPLNVDKVDLTEGAQMLISKGLKVPVIEVSRELNERSASGHSVRRVATAARIWVALGGPPEASPGSTGMPGPK